MSEPQTIRIQILLFAYLKEIVGVPCIELAIPPETSAAGLKDILLQLYPRLGNRLKTTLVSINQQFAQENDLIPAGAEVGLFPPVSGGSDAPMIFKVTNKPLDFNDLVDQITLNSTGAVCIFTGMVRGETLRGTQHQTIALEYEAYVPMAEAKMKQVADEIRQQWPQLQGIVIVQRIGKLDPRTPTVLIACSAAHRDTGVFEAARYGIDRLKEIVPIWKKEIGPDGEEWVEGNYFPSKGD